MKYRFLAIFHRGLAWFLVGLMALPQDISAANQPPVFISVTNQTINVGQNLSVRLRASDPDSPPQTLSFGLLQSPTGAVLTTLRETNAIVRWTPSRDAARSTNSFAVTVADNGSPSLSATQSFEVVVTEYVLAGLGTRVLQDGEEGCLPIQLDSTAPVTNVSFNVRWPEGTLTNFSIQPRVPEICSSNIQFLSPTQAQIHLSVCPGRTLILTQAIEIADLCFTAIAGQTSGFVPIQIPETVVTRLDGTSATNSATGVGRTVVVGEQSLLEAVITPEGQRRLFLYGRPGAVYQIDSTTNLGNPPSWQLACRVPMTGPAIVVCCTDISTNTIFYRALRYSDGPTNQPPLVSAGPDQIIQTNFTTLHGSANDDGLPAACQPLTYAWTNISGPGLVTFSSPTSAVTTVTFSQPGEYVLAIVWLPPGTGLSEI